MSPHVDIQLKHFVMLSMFVTVMGYNEKKQYNNCKKKVSPKQGRVVLFDGTLYHTAEIKDVSLRYLSVDSHI